MRRAFLLLVDGLRPDLLEAECAAGRLPNLAALTEGGTRGRGVTAFPSTTSVAYLPFLTGALPGRCNVPSIRWMDVAAYGGDWWRERDAVRSYCGYQAGMLDADMAADVRTIFELVPESIAFFTMITRGLTPDRDPSQGARKFWGAVAHYALWHQPSDDTVAKGLLKSAAESWRFVFAQFPAVDGYTHQATPFAPKVVRALHRVDAVVGELVATLRRRNELDESLIVLVSDHGATSVHTHLDLADWFRAQGVRTMSHPIVWEREPRAAVMVAGNGSAGVYVRPGTRRAARVPMAALHDPATFEAAGDVVAALVREPGVAFVAAEDGEGGLILECAGGDAQVDRVGERIRYRPRTGDPLRLGGVRDLGPEGWLQAALADPFPDAAVQLLDQFRAARAADLVVLANEGWDFRERFEVPEHKAGHGSIIAGHMLVPCWSNRPVAPLARTPEVYGWLLDWLGVAPAGTHDIGESLLAESAALVP